MINRNQAICIVCVTMLLVLTCSIDSLEKNKIILMQFGPRNGSEYAIGLYELLFYDDGLLQRINFYTNTGTSNNPYDWEKIKLINTDYLEVVRTDSSIKAIYHENQLSQGKIMKWFKLQSNDLIYEMSLDGQTIIGEIRIDYSTGEYSYTKQNEIFGYYRIIDDSREFFRVSDIRKDLFAESKYSINRNTIKLINRAKRFHPQLSSYDDNFQVVYKFDGKMRYTITRTEEDYPADFVDKLDIITTLDTKNISVIASALNSFLVFSPPIGYYTYLHPFVTKK